METSHVRIPTRSHGCYGNIMETTFGSRPQQRLTKLRLHLHVPPK